MILFHIIINIFIADKKSNKRTVNFIYCEDVNMNFNDWNIKTKFLVTQIVITVLITIMMLVALISFSQMSSRMEHFGRVEYENTFAATVVRKDINATAKRLLVALYQSDIEGNSAKDQREDFKERFATMQSYLDQIISTTNDTSITSDLQKKYDNFTSAAYALLDDIESGDLEAAELNYDANFSTDPDSPLILFTNALEDVGEMCESQAHKMIESSNNLSRLVMIVIPVTFIITVVISTFIFTLLANNLTSGIKTVVGAVKKLEKGEFDLVIDTSKLGKDEVGSMILDFDKMAKQTSDVIRDTCYILTEMAAGNFAAKSKCPNEYVGDYSSIISAYDDIHNNLYDIFSKMNEVAAQVETGSSNIANGAMSLSQGSTEQASTLEELSATVLTIRDKVNVNAKSANDVEQFSASVAERISYENEQMSHVKDAMEEIANKSNQIENIIKAIDDIAFQTNILALNAAVEAARAGAAGKGFAVVADEVRNLAGKSASAASETSALIGDTIAAIQNGSRLIITSAASLNEVKESSEKSRELVASIAEEMQKEAVSIAEITTGLEQIAQVVQENSATAEQSSASSQELNDHATDLRSMVAKIIV